jgi:hypothetical protein
LNALSYIDAKAARRAPYGEPEPRRHYTAHDGSDPEEVAIDNLIGAGVPGKAIVISAGNDRAKKTHASGAVPSGTITEVHFSVTSGTYIYFTLWYETTGALYVNLRNPNGFVTSVFIPVGLDRHHDGNRVTVSSTAVSLLNGMERRGPIEAFGTDQLVRMTSSRPRRALVDFVLVSARRRVAPHLIQRPARPGTDRRDRRLAHHEERGSTSLAPWSLPRSLLDDLLLERRLTRDGRSGRDRRAGEMIACSLDDASTRDH